jgi:hypothetical protein
MADETYAETRDRMDRLATTLAANSGDLPHLETHRARLGTLQGEIREVVTQQATLTASKQEATQRLAALIDEGRKLMTFILTAVKHHYGSRSEKIAEFGLQPFRGRPRTAKPEEPTPPPEEKVAANTTP